MDRMRIAVVGAGVGGLAVAHGLQRAGHEVVVLERGRQERRQGSGLSLFPNGLRALDALGLTGHVERLTGGTPPAGGGLRTADGRWLVRARPEVVAGLRVVHREELHAALAGALDAGTVRHRTRVVSVDACSGRVRAVSAEGGRCDLGAHDLVVAADGIRSPIRRGLALDAGVRWAGYGAWRGVTRGPLPGVEPAEVWGRGVRLGLVPLPDERVYWFAVRGGARDAGTTDHADAVLDLFGSWAFPVRQVVEATAPETISWSPIDELRAVPLRFHRHRVVLLGDAAHAMTPDLGQGGNQALEDAATLVALLDAHPRDTALERYTGHRVPRTRAVAQQSRAVGRIAQARHPWSAATRDLLVRLAPAAAAARHSRATTRWTPPR